jgi:YihY family inner membrane protein
VPSRRAQGNDAGIATPGHLADQPAARRAPRGHGARAARALVAFWRKAYTDGITGLAAMIAYNLLLSIFPLALIALYVAGQIVGSGNLEDSVLRDLEQVFPNAADDTLRNALHRVQSTSTTTGVLALVVSVYVSTSFWGALDTAFCRIYHSECRSWVRQKLFALSMLVVVLLFFAASVTVPAAQSLLTTGTKDLPFGLSEVRGLVRVLTVLAGLLVLFATLCVVYWRVPRGAVPWRSIWPGALLATLAMGVVDYGFPLYLNNVSTLAEVGPSVVFALIVLIWFYALAIIVLTGAVVNALRWHPD